MTLAKVQWSWFHVGNPEFVRRSEEERGCARDQRTEQSQMPSRKEEESRVMRPRTGTGPHTRELKHTGSGEWMVVRHPKPMRSKGSEHLKVALARVHENSVCMKNPKYARRLEREHEYARYR